MFVLLVTSMLTLAFNIQPVKASGTIYIRDDGSVDPPTAPISTVDNITYTFTGDINDSIVIERDNIVVDGAGYTMLGKGENGITLSGRSNVTIKNTNIKDCWLGIYLNSSSNNSLSGNNITANYYAGIYLESSSNYNSISGNNITNNWAGIMLESSSNYNSISGNNITANDYYGYGILLGYSSNNSISGNNIARNGYGVYLPSSSYSIISENNITANYRFGIVLESSSDYNSISGNNITNNAYGIYLHFSLSNSIFHNNVINNAPQVYSSDSVNVWDDGYPSGGNHWSDYLGNDTYSGPYQNETGSDNIGDTQYVIDTDSVDHYPLMNPYVSPLQPTFTTVMESNTTDWDAAGIGAPFVIYDANASLYKMWFSGLSYPIIPYYQNRYVIAYAESNDGITWFNKTVVHDTGFGYPTTGWPWVVKEGETYRMWHMDYYEWVAGDWSSYVACMNSTDGINWPAFMSTNDTKVLSAQGQSDPQGDGYCAFAPCVVYDPSIGYVMWYSVLDHPQPGMLGPPKIWRATSDDGITWSNRTPALPYVPSTWEAGVYRASVVKEDDGSYTMFYGAGDNNGTASLGMAESIDGISWTNRTQILKPSDLGVNINSTGSPFHFQDVSGKRYLYFAYDDKSDGKSKFGRIQLGARVLTSLNITATAGGTTNPPPGTYTYSQGQTVPVQAAPDIGYVFDHWELDSTNVSLTNPISVLMDENHTLHAVFVEMNYTLQIKTTVGGTTNPVADTYTYPAGLAIQVTGIPDTGYYFDHWELNGTSIGSTNPVTITMDADYTLNATFSLIINRTLSITATTGGTTSPVPGTYTYGNGTIVDVVANATSGFVLDHWELDNVSVGSSNPVTVVMDRDHSLNAVFKPLYVLDITATDGGTTDPSTGNYTYIEGTMVTVNATPSGYYGFDHWELDGYNVSSVNPCTVLMDKNHALHAVFIQINYTLTITATDGGTTNPSPGIYTYVAGSSVQVEAIANTDYLLDYWKLDGNDVGAANPISVTMDTNHTLHAVFRVLVHDVAVTDVVPSRTVIGQGYSNSISVTVANQGDYTETFNVTVYANTTAIGTQTANDLLNGASIVLTFTLNTTDFAYDNYTISAYAEPVLNETDTTDNTYVDGTVQIVPSFHDAAIVSITFSKQNPAPDETLDIYVTVENLGNLLETFDVSVNYTRGRDFLIGTTTITLEPGARNTLGFAWTPPSTGRYEITAYTSPIPEDTNPTDNTRSVRKCVMLLEGPFYTWNRTEYWIVQCGGRPVRLISKY